MSHEWLAECITGNTDILYSHEEYEVYKSVLDKVKEACNMTKERLEEIATQALSYLQEYGMLDDFIDEFGIDLTESERCFFDLTDDEEDE